MVVHMRHTRGHTGNRRSHHALKTKNLIQCSNCNSFKESHTVCRTCGQYNGRVVVDVLKKTQKKAVAQ